MSRELPLYQGAAPQSPRQQMQGPGFTPHVQPMGGMLDTAIQAGLGAVEQYAELKDFGASQQAEHERRLNDQKMRDEFKSKMEIPWGSEGSFYDSEGNRREDEVNAFIIKWQEKNNQVPRPFWLEKNAMRDEGDLMQANDALASRVKLMTLDAEAKNRKQAFLDNYDLAVDQEDWSGAHRLIDRAVEASQITRARGEGMKLEVNKKNALKYFKNLSATNPGDAYDLLNSDEYKDLFSPAECEEMRRGLAARRDRDSNDFFRSFVLTKPDSGNAKGSGKKGGDALARSGWFTPNEIRWGNLIREGKGSSVLEEIRWAAIDEAMYFNPSLSDEGMELAREKYLDKYMRYKDAGITKEFLIRQWTAAEDLRKKLKTPTLDIKGRLDLLEKKGLLLNRGAFNAENFRYSNVDDWGIGGRFRDEFMGQLALRGMESNETVMNKYMAFARANHAAGLKSQITERFYSWRKNEGKDASLVEQQVKLINITRYITGNNNISFVDDGPSLMDKEQELSRLAQKSRFDIWRAKQGDTLEWVGEQQQETPATRRVSVGFDTTRKDLPDGILLPRSMMKGVKVGEDAVELTFDNKHIRVATVVGVCEGDSPKLTYGAARGGAYNTERVYSLDMRVLSGKEAKPLIKAQEAAISAGKKVKVKQAALGGLAPYKQAFINAGKKYGMTPDQVNIGIAIAMHETGRGSSYAFRNKKNAMGISPNGGGPRFFDSVEDGIDYGMRNLKMNYFDQGLTTIAAIGRKYAPIGAGNDPRNLNRHWVKGVSKYYNSL